MASVSDRDDNCESLAELTLKEDLLHALILEKQRTFEKDIIRGGIEGRDVIILPGMCKYLHYVIIALQRVNTLNTTFQALVITSSTPSAIKADKIIKKVGSFLDVKTRLSIKDAKVFDPTSYFHVVVGTPFHVRDLLLRGAIKTRNLLLLVIDSVDLILSSRDNANLYYIMQYIEYDVQIVISCSEISENTLDFVRKFLRMPLKINLPQAEVFWKLTSRQFVVQVGDDARKLEVLLDLYGSMRISQAVIFCRSAFEVDWLAEEMLGRGFTVSRAHEDIDEEEVFRHVDRFRRGDSRVLVSDDGCLGLLEATAVSLVVMYDLPEEASLYGPRALCAGSRGSVVSLVSHGDRQAALLKEIEARLATVLPTMARAVPGARQGRAE